MIWFVGIGASIALGCMVWGASALVSLAILVHGSFDSDVGLPPLEPSVDLEFGAFLNCFSVLYSVSPVVVGFGYFQEVGWEDVVFFLKNGSSFQLGV